MCRAILVRDCHLKERVFAVSRICAISGRYAYFPAYPFRPQRPAGDDAVHPLNAGIGLQEVRFRPAVDGRMEGIDEMWMRSEPCWPKAVLMYA